MDYLLQGNDSSEPDLPVKIFLGAWPFLQIRAEYIGWVKNAPNQKSDLGLGSITLRTISNSDLEFQFSVHQEIIFTNLQDL